MPDAPAPDAPRSRPARRAAWRCRPPGNGRTTQTPTHANANTTHPLSGLWSLIRHSRINTIRKMFDCKKCPVHWGSFIKHHGLFVPYIVDIFNCEKYNIHLVSFIKNHGLFVPYIDDIFIFLIRISWLSPTFIHSPIPRVLNFF